MVRATEEPRDPCRSCEPRAEEARETEDEEEEEDEGEEEEEATAAQERPGYALALCTSRRREHGIMSVFGNGDLLEEIVETTEEQEADLCR
jgi:hypothetical protein